MYPMIDDCAFTLDLTATPTEADLPTRPPPGAVWCLTQEEMAREEEESYQAWVEFCREEFRGEDPDPTYRQLLRRCLRTALAEALEILDDAGDDPDPYLYASIGTLHQLTGMALGDVA